MKHFKKYLTDSRKIGKNKKQNIQPITTGGK